MANDLDIHEQTEVAPVEVPVVRATGNPIDKVAPTCMFWAMVIGLSLMLGLLLIWGISHIGLIGT